MTGAHPRTRAATAAAVALLAALAVTPASAADVELEARLEPEVLGVDGVAFFSIEARGGVFSRVGFEPEFELVNFEQVGGPARSENLQWVNGSTSRSLRLTWRLRPLGLGQAAVRGIRVEVGGERYDLPAQAARVVEDPPPSSRRRPPTGSRRPPLPGRRFPDPLDDLMGRRSQRTRGEPEIRLVAEATPERAWTGQQVTYRLWLYTQTNISRVSLSEQPDFRGFWVEEVPRDEDRAAEPVELDGERFWRTPLLERALFPRRPGRYELSPAEVHLVARIAPSDPFGRLLPRSERLHLVSGAVTVDVRPLPPPPPDLADRFGGLVGDLSLDARLVPSELAAGDAATLELHLTGSGHVEGLGDPRPPAPDGLRLLPAEESGGNRLRGSRVRADRTWRIPVVPERPGTWRLPPVEMAYFDPDAGRYRLAASPPLVLRARRGEPETAMAGGPALHPIKNAALPAPDPGPRWHTTLPWLFALPWAVVLVASLAARRRDDGARGPLERFEGRLAEAAGEERPRRAAIALEAAWHDLLAERFDVPGDTTPSRWPEHLSDAAAAPRDRAELARLVEDLHYLRNAPQLSAIAQLTGELVDRSRRLARRLVG